MSDRLVRPRRMAPRGWDHDGWCPRLSGPQFDCLCFADRMPNIARAVRNSRNITTLDRPAKKEP